MTTNAELLNQMSALVNSWQIYIDQQRAIATGTADAIVAPPAGAAPQPAPGWYPLTDPAGFTTWQPCAARIRVEAQTMVYERRALATGSTIVLAVADIGKTLLVAGTTGTANISVRLPTAASSGWWVNLIQEGSGGPRATVTIAPDVDGSPVAFLRQRASAFRLTNQYAFATAICTVRDGAGRPTFILGGDLTQ